MSGLMVVGVPLLTGDKFVPRLTMRRIFNTKCFREERYRHEIANHYRDYKMQMQRHQLSHSTHRQRQRSQHRRQTRPHRLETSFTASLASQCTQFRGVWPTHVHYFPRFGDTYAPRGRQTICSGEPPDETYNAAVRLIKRAQSCEQLKELVHRQLRHRRQRRQQRQQLQNAADDDNDEDDDDDSNNSNKSNTKNSGTSGQRDHGGSNNVNRNHYKLNINKNKVENLQRQQQQKQYQQQQHQQQRRRIDFYSFLQLASGYYEQGLQANIKYLESIGKRNAIKTKQQQRQQQQQQQHPHLGDTIDGAALPLVKLLKGWRRRKRTSGNSCCPSSESDAISVHIRPNIAQQQQQRQRQQHQSEVVEQLNFNSKLNMCDYFAELCRNNSNGSNSSSSSLASPTSTASAVAIIDQCKFYEIIDNLSQLSLTTNESNIDRLQLPLITLTDYTQQVAASQQQQQQQQQQLQLHIPNEARPPKNGSTST